jgi:branched-chain amino acid aminotransferase
MKRYCYYNGKIVPVEKVLIPVTDIGFLRGFGIFDYIKVYDGVPFLLKEHVARLKRSAKVMGLRMPYKDQEIYTMCAELLSYSKAPLAALRIIITGGAIVGGLSFDPHKQTFIIIVEELSALPNDLYTKGARLMTYEHERLFPEVKTLNYITAVKLQKERIKRKAIEILYTHNSKILEATTSNFFLIKGTKLITSKDSILMGVTRNHILKLGEKSGFTLVERDIMLSDLATADEAFITATNKEIMPIVAIDGKNIGDGMVGPGTQLLMEIFQQSIQTYVRRSIAHHS